MSVRALRESGGALRIAESGKWAATLITPGQGSSGTYSEEVLERDAPTAFRKGMKLWWGHPKEGEHAGDRDARDQWGVLDEDASYERGVGIVGKIRLLPHWKDVVESLGDQASLSVYAMGDSDDEGNVTALCEHVTNSVDIVSYPGREGSGLTKKIEAARAASPQPGAASARESNNTQEESMEEVLKAIEALATEFKSFVAEQKAAADAAAKAEADAEAKDKDVSEAVEAAITSVEAIKAAKVLASFEEKLIESAKKGEDVSADLEFAKKVTAEAAAPKRDDATGITFVHESAATTDDFSLNLGGRL